MKQDTDNNENSSGSSPNGLKLELRLDTRVILAIISLLASLIAAGAFMS